LRGRTVPIATTKKRKTASPAASSLQRILGWLEDGLAEDVTVIDLAGKTAMADYMVVASGRSQRHLAAMADQLREHLKSPGAAPTPIEGLRQGDWVLVDAGDVVVHLFRPEVRAVYNLEKMWGMKLPGEDAAAKGEAAKGEGTPKPPRPSRSRAGAAGPAPKAPAGRKPTGPKPIRSKPTGPKPTGPKPGAQSGAKGGSARPRSKGAAPGRSGTGERSRTPRSRPRPV
jgi:ribosome-associated protein